MSTQPKTALSSHSPSDTIWQISFDPNTLAVAACRVKEMNWGSMERDPLAVYICGEQQERVKRYVCWHQAHHKSSFCHPVHLVSLRLLLNVSC